MSLFIHARHCEEAQADEAIQPLFLDRHAALAARDDDQLSPVIAALVAAIHVFVDPGKSTG